MKNNIRKKLIHCLRNPSRIHVISARSKWSVRRETSKRAIKIVSSRESAVQVALLAKDWTTIVVHDVNGETDFRIVKEYVLR